MPVSVIASSVRKSSALGIVRMRDRGIPRCWSTYGSSDLSVAITASAAAAHRRTDRRNGR
jgi:hypothetical protein